MTSPTKDQRIEARVTAETKAVIEQAASLEGISITDFVVQAAREAAERTIRSHMVISLSARDSRRFAEALLNPPEPNDALRRAFASAREHIREE